MLSIHGSLTSLTIQYTSYTIHNDKSIYYLYKTENITSIYITTVHYAIKKTKSELYYNKLSNYSCYIHMIM